MKRTIGFTVLVLAAGAVVIPATAQVTAPADGAGSTVPEKQVPQTGGSSGESLSSKLNKSDGVIAPQTNVDPGIHVPAPDPHPNSTPVIPPAATGGNSAK